MEGGEKMTRRKTEMEGTNGGKERERKRGRERERESFTLMVLRMV